VLDDGGTIITESAAICMHIAEKYPQSRLLPLGGTLERSQCYKWTSYIITELDAPLWTIAKHRFALPRERRVPAVIETAGWEFGVAVKVLATGLGDREYLVGDCVTVADIVAGHTLAWAKSARLVLGSDQLERYLGRLLARNAVRRARERTQGSPVIEPADR
jgi:glutathione S-transferase